MSADSPKGGESRVDYPRDAFFDRQRVRENGAKSALGERASSALLALLGYAEVDGEWSHLERRTRMVDRSAAIGAACDEVEHGAVAIARVT